ncbi:hypothetical protein D9M71_688200 [compost metagenome]
MQKAQRLQCIGRQRFGVGAHGFEQVESANDIGVDECLRAVDGAIDMGLGGKIENGAGLVLFEQVLDQGTVTDIALHEYMLRIARQAAEVIQVACIGQLVQIDYGFVGVGQPFQDEICPNEACTASYQDGH